MMPEPEAVAAKKWCSDFANSHRSLHFHQTLGHHVSVMYCDRLMAKDQIKCAVALAKDAVTLLATAVLKQVGEVAPGAEQQVAGIFADAGVGIDALNDVEKTCELQCSKKPLTTIERPLLRDARDEKRFAFISLIALLTDLMQHDAVARRHIVAASEDWSTGKYYRKEPTIQTDLTDGVRFRWSPLARPRDQHEKLRRVRIGIDIWGDGFTVSGFGRDARWADQESTPRAHSLGREARVTRPYARGSPSCSRVATSRERRPQRRQCPLSACSRPRGGGAGGEMAPLHRCRNHRHHHHRHHIQPTFTLATHVATMLLQRCNTYCSRCKL